MLLGASGQNIYPEEIEDLLNNLTLVNESIVIQKEKTYGLVYPDFEEAHNLGLQDSDLANVMEQNRTELNSMLPGYAQLPVSKSSKRNSRKPLRKASNVTCTRIARYSPGSQIKTKVTNLPKKKHKSKRQ